MAKLDPRDKQLARAQRKAENTIQDLLKSHFVYMQESTRHVLEDMKWAPNQTLLQVPENIARWNQHLKRLRTATDDFIRDNIADQNYLDALERGMPEPPPQTFFGEAADLANWFYGQSMDISMIEYDLIVAQNVAQSVNDVKAMNDLHREDLNSAIQRGMRQAATHDELRQFIQEAGFRKSHAQTIMRGVVMQSFRNVDTAHAKNIYPAGTSQDDMYFTHTGPVPIPMPHGHIFCVDHWRETHTLAEWRDIAESYGDTGDGLDPNRLLDWCGGYQCRHRFLGADIRDIPELQKQESEYRELKERSWQETANALDEYGETVPADYGYGTRQ